ncbi:carboxymuconolactone decarboxylase family protein [Dongia deserti]|uniref:carboxymuconolactone decarboxylase family protein n=1 Tax=Dongia deserti TaxID=2268030 RepID=UPI000E65368E|nr:carboxymuconolactone decarboxylase family protein [Dongia deserti]
MYEMKNLARLSALKRTIPDTMAAFDAFGDAALAEGALPRKVKELIAVAVALTTQCPYCIEIHSKEARSAGATDLELAETAMLAAVMRAGGAITHAAHLFPAAERIAQAAK